MPDRKRAANYRKRTAGGSYAGLHMNSCLTGYRPVCPPFRIWRPVDFKIAAQSIDYQSPLFEPSIMEKLLSAEQIDEGVGRLAEEIFTFYSGQPVTIVGILNGSIMLLADLIRRLDMPLRIALVQASSYRDTTESGALRLDMSMLPEIRGRQVLLVDDIFDTGNTLAALVEQVRQAGAASVRTVVLLRKHGRKAVSMEPDHVGFEIPNQFVVGYGLDYRDMYRNLPYVAVLAEADL
jgi:hypoxanthine phosphoribosyltransferase